MMFSQTVKVRTPWLSMVTSLPLLGILCGHFASNWGNYTLLTMLPTYMSTILKFDITSVSGSNTLIFVTDYVLVVKMVTQY